MDCSGTLVLLASRTTLHGHCNAVISWQWSDEDFGEDKLAPQSCQNGEFQQHYPLGWGTPHHLATNQCDHGGGSDGKR